MSAKRARTKRILVVANEGAEEETLHEVIRSCSEGADAEVLVIAAASRLDAYVERLQDAGIRARGWVGDADPLHAVSEGLDGFAADEIVLATGKRSSRNLMQRVRSRFAGPIFHLTAGAVARPRVRRLGPPTPLIPQLSQRR